ncbi:hypothetical protein H8S33_01965 [Ornithinibacillus sp. BX22]|uniref:Uncharacterized protein n=2 Tax=Ornithinibacillus TaxID=484508 RepID=A0A923L369_9BACI|nr:MULTISPECIES: hypothetical protein [Ornithinibacillus]MBC5635581.1 hypothetical protein [Ornithinibacillus hominis]MBS3679192.1 hypothetical protein [Ornithinibacillus massiliensis]
MKRNVFAMLVSLIFLFALPTSYGMAEKSADEWNRLEEEKVNQGVELENSNPIIFITIMVLLIGAILRVWNVIYKKRRNNQGGN